MLVPELFHPWIAVFVTLAVFVALQIRRGASVDVLFLGGLIVVVAVGIISPQEAFAGFANPAVLTIGALLVVAAGLRSAGVLDWIQRKLLGNVSTHEGELSIGGHRGRVWPVEMSRARGEQLIASSSRSGV